jgi:hypothetical protein
MAYNTRAKQRKKRAGPKGPKPSTPTRPELAAAVMYLVSQSLEVREHERIVRRYILGLAVTNVVMGALVALVVYV